jgi:enediyne biosynthesis protein E4
MMNVLIFSKKTVLLGLTISLILVACKKNTSEKQVFEQIEAKDSGVTFTNNITETKDFNILDYLYFYNGAGVSAGDINNDGLVDLYFVSTQGKNKLYLNKGLKVGKPNFEDITEKAGVEGFADWQTGCTMADVNGDGLLDIYVSAVGNFKGMEGSNELYINNGDNTFTEKASQYGLDFTGFSTQAAFFDYDKDGDLDCYLLNHAVHTSRSYDRVSTRMLKDNEAGDYLYKNEGSKFKDVSKESGIYQAAMGYGLGISVADFNNDGWEDIYVSNDFHEDDYYYINQKNGTFKEEIKEHFKHLSRFSMGNDAADINNDGYQDIMTLDMLSNDETVEKSSVGEDPLDIFLYKLQFGYFNQYSRNTLQLNMGGQKFSDVAALSGVAATDWSWSPLLADFDNDGHKDIFITNGILRRPNDLDYLKFVVSDSLHYGLPTSQKLDQQAIDLMPDGKWNNFIFKGTDSLIFEDKSVAWGFEKKNISNGAAYADLDNDGDLDLITNNLNEEAGIYVNHSDQKEGNNYLKIKLAGEAQNKFGVGAKVVLYQNGQLQLQQLMPTRGFMSSSEPALLFGLGTKNIDSLMVIWESGKWQKILSPKATQTLTLKETDAQKTPMQLQLAVTSAQLFAAHTNPTAYVHKENTYFDFNRESLIPFKLSQEGPKMAVADIDADGQEDLFVCGAKYQPGTMYLQKNGKFIVSNQKTFLADSLYEDVDALFFDADGDKDQDLYVVSGGNEFYGEMEQQWDRLYINDGRGNFAKNTTALPKMYSNKAVVTAADYDKDGDTDLFVGGRVVPYNYGQNPKSYLLQNNGKGQFSDVTDNLAPELRHIGMVTDATWADTDIDGDQDLTVVGEWMGIITFENKKTSFNQVDNGLENITGFYRGIAAADFDKDGDLDLVVGNLGTNTKLRKEPNGKLKMWAKDIDANDSKEQIIAYTRNGKYYPTASKDEMGKQMPGIINKRFSQYRDFAGKAVEDIFESKELKNANVKEINNFHSLYLENTGNNQFKTKHLPTLAQVSKIMTMLVTDVNADGNPDVILGGNYDGASMYQSRYDASFGLILAGDGKGNFNPMVPTDTGLMLDGDVRDIKKIKVGNSTKYVVARNNTSWQWFDFLGK